MKDNGSGSGFYHYCIEQENRELQKKQVRKINDTLRKVRKMSKESHQRLQAATATPGADASVAVVAAPVADDDGGDFEIPEPSTLPVVTAALERAIHLVESEREDHNRSEKGRGSKVVKRWSILG